MSENIYDLANNLERAIRQLPEYQTVSEAKAQIDQDSEASALFKEYSDFQKQLQEVLQSGQVPDQEMQDKMQQLSQKIQAAPLLSDYFAKHQQLSVYLADIERIVFSPVQDLMK